MTLIIGGAVLAMLIVAVVLIAGVGGKKSEK